MDLEAKIRTVEEIQKKAGEHTKLCQEHFDKGTQYADQLKQLNEQFQINGESIAKLVEHTRLVREYMEKGKEHTRLAGEYAEKARECVKQADDLLKFIKAERVKEVNLN